MKKKKRVKDLTREEYESCWDQLARVIVEVEEKRELVIRCPSNRGSLNSNQVGLSLSEVTGGVTLIAINKYDLSQDSGLITFCDDGSQHVGRCISSDLGFDMREGVSYNKLKFS